MSTRAPLISRQWLSWSCFKGQWPTLTHILSFRTIAQIFADDLDAMFGLTPEVEKLNKDVEDKWVDIDPTTADYIATMLATSRSQPYSHAHTLQSPYSQNTRA
jgi:hypothetical protein